MSPHIDVVAEQDVDAVEAEPFETRFQRASNRVVGVVVAYGDRLGIPHPGVALALGFRHQQPADLGRKHEVVPWQGTQGLAEALLAQAVPVQRRRVEIADSAPVCSLDDGGGCFRADPVADGPQGGAAEAEFGDFDAA